ncbi:hypothetical protein ACTOB_006541 [Actinoplanes oblitus]|uniref:Glutathionylspermidine synthase pre-ATP-grasp-like domain-containing protein n=1 Tax=Actinoplanes oblitus TaxID=3040509 RepID=A0ABY8WFK6_9ACTN|nr:hypothetical protein [Actinoplanes oblitus]WIM94515.1 hypothetical protein ACTOB_006541 [Actinoplanes oblitus]
MTSSEILAPAPLLAGEPEEIRDRLRHGMRDVPFPPNPVPLHPVLLPAATYEELHSAAAAVLGVLFRAARRLGNDRGERLAALGIDPVTAPLFTGDDEWEWRYAACIARPDAFVTPDGVKLIEYNVGGGVGAAVQTQLLGDTWVDDIYAGRGLSAYRPYAARADLFEETAAREGTDRAVALVGSVADLVRGVTSTRYFDSEVDYLRRRGLRAEFFEPTDLMDGLFTRDGRLSYPLGLRHFTVQEWGEMGLDWSPLGEALAAGCQLLASQTSALLSNKKLLAVASAGQPGMSAQDRELVQRYLPWTRVVGTQQVRYQGALHRLDELLLACPERFLLKGAIGMKGEKVLMGRDTDTATWRAAVGAAVHAGDSIAQERVESLRYPMSVRAEDGSVTTGLVAPVLGPFVIGGRPGGCLARFFPDGADGVISVERHGGLQNIAVAAH